MIFFDLTYRISILLTVLPHPSYINKVSASVLKVLAFGFGSKDQVQGAPVGPLFEEGASMWTVGAGCSHANASTPKSMGLLQRALSWVWEQPKYNNC